MKKSKKWMTIDVSLNIRQLIDTNTNEFVTVFSLFSTVGTIDSEEVENFQKLAAEWWNPCGPLKPLHSMNKLRIPLVRDGLINEGCIAIVHVRTSTPLKGMSVLDVGCGGGILSEPLARLGAVVTGLDATSNALDVARKHAKDNNLAINYMCSSVEEFSQNNIGKFDAVVASEVVEHVTEKASFIAACSKCLKPSGSIFITTLNDTFLAHFLGVWMAENMLSLVPRGTHQSEKFVKPHQLQRILEDNGLRTKLMHGMIYNFVTNNWSWSSNRSINYAMHAVKNADL
ncbi:hypothetical protein HUJ04_005490 [Dendroctonus ponderosae]|uniref:Ubiquinone biosynthesis O-methyltransferase, mitochondrial n=1 Tax=Dendroctonus ponderosae TaxID=77166 RepID=A0AAR5Q927_DENPD|nr:hypothetical protein HUJ04_005490 [Dendroctonus ponderosae]